MDLVLGWNWGTFKLPLLISLTLICKNLTCCRIGESFHESDDLSTFEFKSIILSSADDFILTVTVGFMLVSFVSKKCTSLISHKRT